MNHCIRNTHHINDPVQFTPQRPISPPTTHSSAPFHPLRPIPSTSSITTLLISRKPQSTNTILIYINKHHSIERLLDLYIAYNIAWSFTGWMDQIFSTLYYLHRRTMTPYCMLYCLSSQPGSYWQEYISLSKVSEFKSSPCKHFCWTIFFNLNEFCSPTRTIHLIILLYFI